MFIRKWVLSLQKSGMIFTQALFGKMSIRIVKVTIAITCASFVQGFVGLLDAAPPNAYLSWHDSLASRVAASADRSEILVIMDPPIIINAWDTERETEKFIEKLAESSPEKSLLWKSIPAPAISLQYQEALKHAVPATARLNSEQKTAFDRANSKLFTSAGEKTAAYRNYLDYQASKKALQEMYQREADPAKKLVIEGQIRNLDGSQNEDEINRIETALETVRTLEGLNPASYLKRLQDLVDGFKDHVKPIFIPAVSEWLEDSDWTPSPALPVSTGNLTGSLSWPEGIEAILVRSKGEPNEKKLSSSLSVDQYEYRIVEIKRPWMDETLFSARNWKLPNGFPALSGTGSKLQMIPTHLVLTRNTRFGGLGPDENAFLAETADANAIASFGPHLLCGWYLPGPMFSRRSRWVRGEPRGPKTWLNPFVVISAVVCAVPPAAPNPDPSLSFPQ